MDEENPFKFIGNIVNLTGSKVIVDIPFHKFKNNIQPDGCIEFNEVPVFASEMGIYQLHYPELKIKLFKNRLENISKGDIFLVTHHIATILYGQEERKILFPIDQNFVGDDIVCSGLGRFSVNTNLFGFQQAEG
jgi:hypothetical protein